MRTVVHRLRRLCCFAYQAHASIQRSVKSDSTLTLAPVLCLRLGSAAEREPALPPRLIFISHRDYPIHKVQNGDRAQIRTAAPKVTAAAACEIRVLMNNLQPSPQRKRVIPGGCASRPLACSQT